LAASRDPWTPSRARSRPVTHPGSPRPVRAVTVGHAPKRGVIDAGGLLRGRRDGRPGGPRQPAPSGAAHPGAGGRAAPASADRDADRRHRPGEPVGARRPGGGARLLDDVVPPVPRHHAAPRRHVPAPPPPGPERRGALAKPDREILLELGRRPGNQQRHGEGDDSTRKAFSRLQSSLPTRVPGVG